MISTTTLTRAARVAFQGYLTAAFFKTIVVDRTIEVVSRSEKVSIRLVTSTVCSSTAVLLIATTKAAQQFLSDDLQRVPAHKDIDGAAEPNARFAGGRVADAISTTKAFGAPAQPSSSRAVIESTEPAFDGPTEGLSTIDSDMTLIACDEDSAKDIFSGDCVSDTTDLDSESLADESTLYEDDCQATAQCLTDDEPEHTLHTEYDSHTINDLIQRMSTLSLDHVPSHLSSLDNVSSPISTLSLDHVPSHLSSLDNVPSHISTISPGDVFSHTSILPLDNVSSPILTLSLDHVPSHLSSLDNAPSHISTISPDDVPSHLPPLDNVPSHIPTISPDDVPSHLPPLDNVPSRLTTIWPHPDNGSPQSSKCQPQRTAVHDHAVDDLIQKMVALSLHDHAFDALLQKLEALTFDGNHAIDVLLHKSESLTLDDNHAIDALLQKSEALALDENPAINAPALDDSPAINAPALDDNPAINAPTLDDNPAINAPALDDNHTINTLALNDNYAVDVPLHKFEALTVDHDHAIDALLHKSSRLSKRMLHDNTNNSSSRQHLRRNTTDTLLRNIEAIHPRNFNYDSPYTTMLSTPYFEIWNLLFSTIVPLSHQNVSHNTLLARPQYRHPTS
ncbi:hypothetical protein DFJ58DRAFT_306047 [Suillus subalutaceus]|uniref:uncharacterized protein n=1 Tax=Suillus subalutaceus TaxID=48586 RepID=UPI001B879289|nr:uncharacterized protein DFJ58DRAFT_306047 [Suillus subalutaceus]KAG1858387.1 hypothetical protein DFJ58DRAFT_306047 [Suillus subalutaceus]